ncbi:hypothetical protein COV15_01825 [Candidatus Woesearchaeota archaeon CG10_big_fil_rev_8_21_14_0_10_34_12]|nr:MAG: hypothetical protein COV15_01825 [Candidatus Woesearchaeota archaeon CG10_big_fil_rev_8_21_14_0_10_34_12]
MRKEEIKNKITVTADSIEIVKENFPDSFKNFSDSGLIKDGIYKKIEFAIESIIDIFNIINSDLRLGVPEVEEDVLNNLRKNKIFNSNILGLVEEMKGFRNILVHRYGEINDKQAFETIKAGLKDFELIIEEIEDFLKKN